MGDAAKQVRSRGKMDEDDFNRSPVKSHSGHELYGKKVERDSQKPKPIAIIYGSHPQNGPHQNTVKNFSPGGQESCNHKDSIKQEQRSNSDNWRERRQQTYNRSRNNSTNEPVDGGWWPDVGERRNLMGRRQNHKDAAADFHDSFKHGKIKHERPRHQSEQYEDEFLESPIVDESVLSKKELLGLQQAEERLKRDCIYRLKRRPRKHPTATYTCKLCETLVDSISSAHKHIKDKRHRRNVKDKREEELLTTLPPPTLPQIQAIDVAIGKIVQEHGLDEEDLSKRQSILSAMEKIIKERLPGCSLRLYGSSCSRMGFRNSDLNIDIQFPASMIQPDVLLLVQESLKQSDLFTDFDTDFHARVPVVVCREKQSGLLCKVSAGNENACLTTNLLATLGRLESRLLPLVVTFRYWAKLCGIDKPEEGGLPQYVLALMVVFFLQQRKEPILPVYLGFWIEGFTISKLSQFSLQETECECVHWEYGSAGDGENVQKGASIKGKTPLIFDAEKQFSASVGQLWVDLLRFYALEFNMADLVISIRVKENISRELKDWPKKRIAVEDPYSAKRNVARSMNSQLVYEYMLHCLKATYKYFAMPQNKSEKSARKPAGSRTAADNECVQPVNDSHLMPVENISRELETLAIGHDDMSGDPVTSHRKLDNTVKKQLVYESYSDAPLEDVDCVQEDITGDPEDFLQSCEEQESPHEESDDDHSFREDEDSESGDAPVAGNETDSLSDFEGGVVSKGEDFVLEGRDIYVGKDDLDQGSTEGTDELEETLHEFAAPDFHTAAINSADDEEDDEENSLILIHRQHLDSLVDEELENRIVSENEMSEDDHAGHVLADNLKDLKAASAISDSEYLQAESLEKLALDNCLFYEFNKPTFTKGKLPTVVCYLCKKEGHLKRDCPEDFKRIELETLPPLTSKFRQILDQVCMQCYEDFSPTTLEDKARELIRQDLEEFIRREFQGARLSLFGSSKNGFGFKQSDLDICLTFDGLETAEELDSIWTIEELARHLRKHQGLRNILSITTAKVPIVKFYHVRSGLEGDISLYNTLALHNTHLLASYAAIDPRVKYLCYIMKVFTKICDIGDASRGSLSSYAYTLMVLYFLQQRNPPVLPVLQEIYIDGNKPEKLVDGWNVYFFANLEELGKYWPDFGKNEESVGELWLGLLRFYTEDFDFKEHVISIRRKSLLTTFKKQWTSKYIVIEDPFDLNHNLGAGLSRKMTNFIMKAFINGRRVFGTPLKGFPKEYPTKMEYFFDPDVLTEGEVAPNDRCCRICGKIGHFMKDCPMRRKVRRRNHEYAANQRYQENRQRKTEDKDINRTTEGESLGKDGKPLYNTPKKSWQGARSPHDACKERTPRLSNERWKRHDERELREKRCFICGREGHVKKDCPQYMAITGSPKSDVLCGSPSASSPQKQGRFIQVIPSQDGKKKQMSFSPQSGSLSSKYMSQGKASQKRAQQQS